MIAPAEIKSAKFRIVQIIGDRLTLKKRGSTWWASCPFHDERTASFAVSESRGRFKCFSCGISGDSLDFLRLFYKTDFRGAVALLGIADDKSAPSFTEIEEKHKEAVRLRAEVNAEAKQLSAGLRFTRRLIEKADPLECDAWWFTAELLLDEWLDELEAQFRA